MGSWQSFFNGLSQLLSGGSDCIIMLSCMGESITFPVAPASFDVVAPYNNDELNVSELGAINMRGKRGLLTAKFSSFFPHPHSLYYDGTDPYTYIETLQRFAESLEPCRLTISNTRVSIYVTVETLSYREKDGTGDVYFDLSLKEYRYLLADSGENNPVTGLTSRVAVAPTIHTQTIIPSMDAMELSMHLTRNVLPIHRQGQVGNAVYRLLAKHRPLAEGTKISLEKGQLIIDDTAISL